MTERNTDALRRILERLREGESNVEAALSDLRDLPFEDLGHTRIDHHRPLRNGFPEVIYAEGKTPEQVAEIFERMARHTGLPRNVLATRVSPEAAAAVQARVPEARWEPIGRTLSLLRATPSPQGLVAIVTAGTSDLPVAEEARASCEAFGCRTRLRSDVGVAGLHRLLDGLDELRQADILIVIAGMEGALASVIGGLVHQPIIAVPTSVGYGANFAGLSALLGMLTSCAAGVTVVNIDNGFGAAAAAARVLRSRSESTES